MNIKIEDIIVNKITVEIRFPYVGNSLNIDTQSREQDGN